MDTGHHFSVFDQPRAACVGCQHVPHELEGLAIRNFVQIALQPKRCLCAVEDELSVRKVGSAFGIGQPAAMIAMEMGEKNGLNRV
jgi:hypothetical protein